VIDADKVSKATVPFRRDHIVTIPKIRPERARVQAEKILEVAPQTKV